MKSADIQIFQQTILRDEKDYIFIQAICDFFEINVENQSRFIKNDIILANESTKKSNNFVFGDNRQRLCLTKKGFFRWIQLLNPNIVREDLKEKLTYYQSAIFEYLYGERVMPNLERHHQIAIRLKEINKVINDLMVEHKLLTQEQKNLISDSYQQLGLIFEDEPGLPSKKLGIHE